MRVFASILAGITLLTVGCSSNVAPPVATKPSEPTVQAALKPDAVNLDPVSNTDGSNSACAGNLQTIHIPSTKTRDFVEIGDTGVIVKVKGEPLPKQGTLATYAFKDAQPGVRDVFVTVATENWHDNQATGWLLSSSTYHYKASWPQQGLMEPIKLTVEAEDFQKDVDRLVGITLCME